MSGFTQIARDLFSFIETEYGYDLLECEDNNVCSYLIYTNTEVGVGLKLLYEFSSAFVFVLIYRLVDGELRENIFPIDEKTEINCFDFNDTLEHNKKMRPAFDYSEESKYFDSSNGLRYYTEEFAERLRLFGEKILIGDLSILPKVEKIIKDRAKEYQN